jgi:hypothetical protein
MRRPVLAGSGDLAGDGRQARKDLSLPAEAARDDHNLVKLALIFPDDDRADLHMPSRPALFAGAEEFANAWIKTNRPARGRSGLWKRQPVVPGRASGAKGPEAGRHSWQP